MKNSSRPLLHDKFSKLGTGHLHAAAAFVIAFDWYAVAAVAHSVALNVVAAGTADSACAVLSVAGGTPVFRCDPLTGKHIDLVIVQNEAVRVAVEANVAVSDFHAVLRSVLADCVSGCS